jgi:hypothetical protein
MSQLKQHIGNKIVYDSLPFQKPDPELRPHAILDRRMVKHKTQAATQVLVH